MVEGFGDEWNRFDYSGFSQTELKEMFNGYFRIFPWENLPDGAVGFDLGCGSGRWAKFVDPKRMSEKFLICDYSHASCLSIKRIIAT